MALSLPLRSYLDKEVAYACGSALSDPFLVMVIVMMMTNLLTGAPTRRPHASRKIGSGSFSLSPLFRGISAVSRAVSLKGSHEREQGA